MINEFVPNMNKPKSVQLFLLIMGSRPPATKIDKSITRHITQNEVDAIRKVHRHYASKIEALTRRVKPTGRDARRISERLIEREIIKRVATRHAVSMI